MIHQFTVFVNRLNVRKGLEAQISRKIKKWKNEPIDLYAKLMPPAQYITRINILYRPGEMYAT